MSMHISSAYWCIRHTGTDAIIARFDTSGGREIPDSVATYDSFQIESMPDLEALRNTTIDQSVLTDSEKQRLSKVFPIIDAQTGGTT
jgi:hypothetical protein